MHIFKYLNYRDKAQEYNFLKIKDDILGKICKSRKKKNSIWHCVVYAFPVLSYRPKGKVKHTDRQTKRIMQRATQYVKVLLMSVRVNQSWCEGSLSLIILGTICAECQTCGPGRRLNRSKSNVYQYLLTFLFLIYSYIHVVWKQKH